MRVIIAGSRTLDGIDYVEEAVHASGFKVDELLVGDARGIDMSAWDWGVNNDKVKRVTGYNAAWKTKGRKAGPIRNAEMVANADALIAIWDGKSRGTADIIRKAKAKGLKVYVHEVRNERME